MQKKEFYQHTTFRTDTAQKKSVFIKTRILVISELILYLRKK